MLQLERWHIFIHLWLCQPFIIIRLFTTSLFGMFLSNLLKKKFFLTLETILKLHDLCKFDHELSNFIFNFIAIFFCNTKGVQKIVNWLIVKLIHHYLLNLLQRSQELTFSINLLHFIH